MSIVGETLHNERIKQGLTISNISKRTNIREYYIVAIEKGRFDRLPGDVYAKGFITNYAKTIGLDYELLISEYKKELDNALNDKIDEKIKKENNLIQKESISLSKQQSINISLLLKIAVIILIFSLLILSFFVVFKNDDNLKQNKGQFAKLTSKSTMTMKSTSKLKTSLINIKILANDKCWTEVEIDGKSKFYGMLNKGQEKDWNAKKVNIKLGNIQAVDIYVNNKKYIPTKQDLINIVVKKEFNIADK